MNSREGRGGVERDAGELEGWKVGGGKLERVEEEEDEEEEEEEGKKGRKEKGVGG